MNISELSHFEKSFSLIKEPETQNFNILGICDRYSFRENFIFFCASKSFWMSLCEAAQSDEVKNVFIIFEKKIFEKIEDDIEKSMKSAAGWAVVDNVGIAISHLSRPFYELEQNKVNDEIDARKLGTAQIDPTAKIAENVFIGADVKIGEDVIIHSGVNILSQSSVEAGTVIYPNVTLMPKSKIGKNCRIHSGTVIGSDGFGYNFDEGIHKKVWHMGGVNIEDNVEIGSNSCIDQGTFSPTIIGNGSKLDNQVQVGHNVQLGRGVILCGQVAIAGSTIVEDFCVFGGQSGVAPDVRIGSGTQVAGGAGVTGSLDSGSIVGGHPARPIKEWLRANATLRKLSLRK